MFNQGGITSAKGFKACGDHVGLKKRRKDLALIYSDAPAVFAATLTTNLAKAAPILWNQNILASGKSIRAVLINSGQANSCTGPQGLLNAARMAEKAASCLNCHPAEIALASTGVIGPQIPMQAALSGIEHLVPQLQASETAGHAAAEAIITTDSYMKECATEVQIAGTRVTIGAMAKGSGMIQPNMATMLSFITTDVAITQELLTKALKQSVNRTYNMISVDGDTSTNDMVAMLANGAAGNSKITEENADFANFCAALDQINLYLSKKIASDAEGATKRLTVNVTGAAGENDARVLARTVVSSNLVKASLFAEDPNWGRIVVALGYAGVVFDPEHLSIEFKSDQGSITAVEGGQEHPLYSLSAAISILKSADVEIDITINSGGKSSATAWGCDLRHDYIRSTGASAKKYDMQTGRPVQSAMENGARVPHIQLAEVG